MFEHTRGRPAATGALRTPPTPLPAPPLHGLRAEWRRLARRLAEPDVELDADTVPALLACYHRLRAAGGVIDAMAEALVLQLGFQLADATVDG